MDLGLRWAFIILLVAYGISALAAVEDFNQIVEENSRDQQNLAFEIQTHLFVTKDKTRESSATQTETIALEGSTLKVYEVNR